MRAIFLCEKEKNCREVYSKSVKERLRGLTGLEDRVYTREELLADPARFADVELIFSTWGMPELSEEEIRACLPKLQCVFYGAGSVQKFARPFLNCGVRVFSAWAANAVPVAEYTVAQILLANKSFFTLSRMLGEKRIQEARERKRANVGNYGAKVGLIGCGMIGSLVAEMLKAYKLEVLVFDPFLSEEKARALNVTSVTLEELFRSCRVVSNHLANNEATTGMLNYALFSSLPVNGTFLNTGRGAQVVEEDLVRALTERPDLTAVLDVTYPEPAAPDHLFYTLPNCFLTPHIAGSEGDELVRMAAYMADEAERYLSGEPCQYGVTAKLLETMA